MACFTLYGLLQYIYCAPALGKSGGKPLVIMLEICLNALHPAEDIPETAHEGLLAIGKVFFGLRHRQEHSVILTLLVGAADTARIPDRTCRYT